MKPRIVGEGKMEERLVKKILQANFPEEEKQLQVIPAGGKSRLITILEPDLDKIPAVLFFRDCDDGETREKICERMAKELKRSRNKKGLDWDKGDFQPIAGWDNIFSFTIPTSLAPIPQIYLHIAGTVSLLKDRLEAYYPFTSMTTDDYILAAALTEGVLKVFAQDRRVGIDPLALQRKVIQKIPSLLRKNGIKNLVGKDMNAIYMAVARFPYIESSESFADKVMGKIIESADNAYHQIFASHIAAIKLLIDKDKVL
jgi:hypothetical protein